MSDIENNTNDLNINTTIDGNAATGTAELSAELVNLTKQLQQLSQAAVKQANVTQSWNQAMGMSKAGVSQYSQQLNSSINVITKLSNATRIYKDVLNEAKKSTEGFAQAQSLISSNKGGLDASFVQRYNAGLVQGQSHLSSMTSGSKDLEKAMKRVALIDISKNISRGAQAESNAAYAFTRNFSAPILGALRESFFSYSKLASESVRTTKLILDNFSNLTEGSEDTSKQMAAAAEFTARLGKELDKVTQSWGTSRVLVQALAGDFAELGISSEYLLADMTRLTVEAEKLGNLDIAQSSSFLTSMYQTILRIRRETGKSVNINEPTGAVSKDIMEQLTGQLAMFNLIENKTVMSLRNISDAFPEVTAAATSFGLSMSEATALIIPMIGAGFQVGASANSLKVSLQRMVAMTKQNTTILNQLNQSLGNGFELSAGVGMDQIQKLSDAYGFLVRDVAKGGKGKQGALELFSRLFGVRQGPRMEAAFAQLNAFQTQLETTGSAEQTVAKQLQNSVNIELKAIGQKEINIKKFKDLSTLHRQAIATDEKGNLTAQAAAIQKGQKEAQKILEKAGGKNADFISNMSTEVGKALMAQAFDTNALAGRQYDLELEISQNTPEVRYRRAKESMLALGRAIVPVVDSILKVLLPAFQKLSSFLQNNPAIAKLTGAFLLLAAAAGPVKLAFATMKTVFGSAIGVFVKLAEKITGVSYAFASLQDLMSNPDLLRGQNKVVQYLDNFLIKTKRNGKALRKEMDLSGLSQPVQEMFKGNKAAAIYGTGKAVNMKRLAPNVSETSQFLDDMKILNIENSTQMAAKVAESSEKGIAKGTEGFSEKFQEAAAKAMHRFQGPNLFAGPNYFEGNIPGDGDGVSSVGRKGRGGGGSGAATAVATGVAATNMGSAADLMTMNRRAKKGITDFFKNPLGIGNIAAGGPMPKNTADGLVSATKKALAAVTRQSSSSPPGGIGLGTAGTSGVLLSTLQKIKEALPKPMSGRIVRNDSQSYGFPLTGQGKMPYPLPSAQQIFPRAAVTAADRLRSQRSFGFGPNSGTTSPLFDPNTLLANISRNRIALGKNPLGPAAMQRFMPPLPKALMPKLVNFDTLSLASLGQMFSDAGVELEAQLVHALSGPESFSVSKKTINEVKRIITEKEGIFSLALSKTGVNETMGGKLITLFSGIQYEKGAGALLQREMAPILEHLNQNITNQVDAGLETIPQAAMKRLNEIKREITPLGLQASPIRTMKKITTAGGTTQYTPILLKDFMHALDSHFISIEDEIQGVIQVANNGLADDLMATQNLFPDVSSQGLVKHPITGQIGTGSTNIHGDMIAQMIRDVEAGRTTMIQGIDEFGRETVQFVELAGVAAERVVDDTVKVYGDLTDLDKKVKFKKGKAVKDIPITETDKIKTVESKLKELKENARKARGASRITALQELDDYIFEQERSITLLRRVEAQNIAKSKYKDPESASRIMSEIENKRRKLEIIKREQAAGIRAGKIPTTSADLKRLDAEAAARILAKQQEIAAEKAMISALPAANPRKKATGLAKLAKPHEQKIKQLEAELLNQMGQRKALLDSPAAIESDIENLLEKMVLAKPADLSDVEKLIESERRKLNTSLKRTGNKELKRRASRRTTSAGLKDFIKGLYQPVSVVGANLEDDVSLMTKAERAEKWYRDNMYQYNQGKQKMTGGTKIDRFKSAVMRIPFTTTPTPDTIGVPLPKGSIPTQVPQLDLTSDADYIRRQSLKQQRKLLKNFFAGQALKAKFIEYPSLSAAAINDGKGGTAIVRQFANQLGDALKGSVTGIGPDADAIVRAMEDLSYSRPSGKAVGGASEGLREFLRSKIDIPNDQIELAMSNALKTVMTRVEIETGAGAAGPRAKAGTLRSWKSFISRMSTGLAGTGKNEKGATTGVIPLTEVFFKKLKRPKIDITTVGGVQRALEDSVISALKGTFPSLESIKTAQAMAAAGKDLSLRGLDVDNEGAGIKRRRATEGGKRANRARAAAKRGGGVKKAVDKVVESIDQELTDVRTEVAAASRYFTDKRFEQASGRKIYIPTAESISKTINAPIDEAKEEIAKGVKSAVSKIPNNVTGSKPLSKTAQEAAQAAAKKLATAFKEIDSSTSRAGEILGTTDLNKIKLNAPLKIKQISESVVMAEKEYAEAFAAAQIAHPTKKSQGINNLSSVAAKKTRLELFKKELKDLEKYINQSLLIEQETARLLSETAEAPKVISATKAKDADDTAEGVPRGEEKKDEEEKPRRRRARHKTRVRGEPIVGGGGDGKSWDIDKIGHRFPGPNIFSKNIFDANLKDIIPNFDDLMVTAGVAVAAGGQTAGTALAEGAAAVTAASVALKQSAISKALFGNKALKGQFAAGAEKSVIESLFGSRMAKKNIIPKYVTEKLEDGTEKTLLSSAERRRSLLPFGKIPIGLPIKQDLADVDRLLTKGVLPNFARLKKLLSGFLGKTWLFALSGGLSVLIGPLTKVIKNFGGLKQVLSGTATIFAQSGSMLKGIAAGAGQITSNVFGGIQKVGKIGLDIFAKLAGAVLLVGSLLLVIVPIIGILIALYGMFKSANGRLAGAATALKEAFKALVDGAKAMFAPVRDLIFVFAGAGKQMGGLTSEGQKNAAFFTIIANAIKKATTAFKEWAETIGAAFVKNTVVPQITRIINKFILLGSAIKDFSNGDKTSGMAKLKAMMLSFAYDIVGILKIITVGLINAFAYAAPVIIQVMQGLLQLLGEMIWAAMKEIGSGIAESSVEGIFKVILKLRPELAAALKIGDLGLDFAQSYGISPLGIPYEKNKQEKKDFEGVDPVLRQYVDKVPGDPPTEAEKNIKKWDAKLRDLIKSAGVGVGGAYDKVLAMLDSRYAEVLGATNIKVNGINVPIVIDKGSPKGVIDQIAFIVKESADAATAGGESLIDQINKGMKSKISEIKDTLKGAFYSNVDEKFDDIVSQYTDALEKQKDQQLKAYDDQITAIDELAAAEGRLTDTKDYESRKREIIDKRQYDNENYSVERKLAVYEGRTFDVRRLDREELASKTDSDKSLTDLDSDRLKTLQAQQRDLAKQAIANQKDLAEEEFDVILKSFDDFMKGVKNKSFSTQEEFAAALKGVADKALSSSLELGTAFETGLAKLPAAIAAVRDPALAMFSASMGDLINEAAISFGINTKSKDPKSLLGAVGLMVSGVEQGFKDAFSTTFAPLYVKPAVDAITLITSSLSKPGDPNNIKDIWTKAGKDAFEALESELNRTIAWEKIFKSFDDLFTGLKPKIKKVVDLAVAAQNALADVSGQTAVTTELDENQLKDFRETVSKSAYTYGGGKLTLPKDSIEFMINRVLKYISSHISEGAAGIIASSKDSNSGLNVTEQGILAHAVSKLNIGGALNLIANPGVYRTDSGGRSGFGATSSTNVSPYYPPSGFDESKMYGGSIGKYGIGGYLKAPASQGIPALLHGGEYIINHKAVEKFGKGNLEKINNLKNGGDLKGFASGGYMTVPGFANGGSVRKYGSGGFLDKLKFGIGGEGPGGPWGGMVTGMRDAIVGGATKGLRFVDDIATGGTFTHMFRAVGASVKGDSKTANIEGLKGLASFGAMLAAPKIIGAALKPVSKFVVKPLAKFGGTYFLEKAGLAGMDITASQALKLGTKTAMTNALGRESAALAGRNALPRLVDQDYLLHHSLNDIKIGDFVRQRLPGAAQSTAGDALPGHSYAWDAQTGITDAVKNQVSGRISRFLPNGLPNLSVPEQFQDFFVHLTKAPKSSIYPDLNIPNSAGRAIASVQEIIDSIKIPANISNDEAEMFIRNMLVKNEVPFSLDPALSSEINKGFTSLKGFDALKIFEEANFEEYSGLLFKDWSNGGGAAWGGGVLGADKKLAYDLYKSGFIEKSKKLLYDIFRTTENTGATKVSSVQKMLELNRLQQTLQNASQLALPRGKSLTLAARGADLFEILNSGQINSSLAKGSGYISNKSMLSNLGIENEGYSRYNAIRDHMESALGVLRGNSNYGYVRHSDDFTTAEQYTRFRVNIREYGELATNPVGARMANIQREMDHMLGAAYINLRPNPAMTYTVGDSWNMYIKGLLNESNPAINIPNNLSSIPLAGVNGENVLNAAGDYTELQFPSIPFNGSTIESITLLRDNLLGKRIPGEIISGGSGWGSEYQHIVSAQEQLVMQRELSQRLANLGIKVQTGVQSLDMEKLIDGSGTVQKPIFDTVPLHEISQAKFDEMLMSITNEMKAAAEAKAARIADDRATSLMYKDTASLAPLIGLGGLGALLSGKDKDIPKFKEGGYLGAPSSQGIPALLHGGEYIINHKAVERFGKGNLERINNLKNGGDFKGFASGGYMTTPGFAKGGAVRRNVGNKPKEIDPKKSKEGMIWFTNKNGESYWMPDRKVRSGAASGMIVHPLDWEALAVSEVGQNWRSKMGDITRTGEGVFVGPLNIARGNWEKFGKGKYGNFKDPLNPPSWENQIKVAELIYTGLPDSPISWYRQIRLLDGFEGLRLGRVDFPKLAELKKYDRLKAQGLANGGLVRKDPRDRRTLGAMPGSYVVAEKGPSWKYGDEDLKETIRAYQKPQTLQGPYATSIPMLAQRTIDLNKLPQVPNKNGGKSTISSASFGLTNKAKGPSILLPTVFKNQIDYSKELIPTIDEFNATGRHLGVYPSLNAAELASSVLHLSEGNRIGKVNSPFAKFGLSNITKSTQALPPEKKEGLSWWKEILRPKNSFAMIGAITGGILGGLGGFGFGAVPGSVGGAITGGGIGEWVEQLFDSKKGFQPLDIAKNAALQGTYDLVGGMIIKNVASPFLRAKFPGLLSGVTAQAMELPFVKPWIYPLINKFKKPLVDEFGNSLIKRGTGDIIDTRLATPKIELPTFSASTMSDIRAVNGIDDVLLNADTVARDLGITVERPSLLADADPFNTPRRYGKGSAFAQGKDIKFDEQILELFDEMDAFATSNFGKFKSYYSKRSIVRSIAQVEGLIPKIMQSPEDLASANSILDELMELMGTGNNAKRITGVNPEDFGGPGDIGSMIGGVIQNAIRESTTDPRIIPSSFEVEDFTDINREIASLIDDYLRVYSWGGGKGNIPDSAGATRGIKDGLEQYVAENKTLLLPEANQPLGNIARYGPEGQDIWKPYHDMIASMYEQMSLAPKMLGPGPIPKLLGPGSKGGELVLDKVSRALAIPDVKYLPIDPYTGLKGIGNTYFSDTGFMNSLNNPREIISEFMQDVYDSGMATQYKGNWFTNFDRFGLPAEGGSATGFNTQLPLKVFPSLPPKANLTHATPFAMFDDVHGFGGLDKNFISEHMPTYASDKFVTDFAIAQSVAQQARHELEIPKIAELMGAGKNAPEWMKADMRLWHGIDIDDLQFDYEKIIADAWSPAQVDHIAMEAAKGQPKAQSIFEELVRTGNMRFEVIRAANAKSVNAMEVHSSLARMKMEDIVFVRELSNKYPSWINPETGAVEIKTPGALNDFFNGASTLEQDPSSEAYKSISGQLGVFRDTVHVAPGNMVNDAGAFFRQVEGNAQYVMFKYDQAFRRINGNAMVNLNPLDVQLTPYPFRSIIIPGKDGAPVKNIVEPGIDLPRVGSELFEFGPGFGFQVPANAGQIINPSETILSSVDNPYVKALRAKINELMEIRFRRSAGTNVYDYADDSLYNFKDFAAIRDPDVQVLMDPTMDKFLKEFLEAYDMYVRTVKESLGITDIDAFKPTFGSNANVPGDFFNPYVQGISPEIDKILLEARGRANIDMADLSQTYGFPLTGQGRIPYSSPSELAGLDIDSLRYDAQRKQGWLDMYTRKYLQSGDFGFGGGKVKYAGRGASETMTLIRELIAAQGKFSLFDLSVEHEASSMGHTVVGRFNQMAHELQIDTAQHSDSWLSLNDVVSQDGTETGIIPLKDLYKIIKTNAIFRYFSTDQQFIQQFPSAYPDNPYPGRFTRLTPIGRQPWMPPPPPPDPGSGAIDIATGEFVGAGMKTPVSKKQAAVATGFNFGGHVKMPRFKKGGYLNFKEGGEVPSILHGGEYVLNAGAVKKYGIAHIEAMNKMRFNVPQPGFSVPQSSFSGSLAGGMTTSTQNVNIYVDNFIGEPEWFNSMMKDYNTTVLPRNQKAAGLENRVISTYSGLNRGN